MQKINLDSNSVIETIDVGSGPQQIEINGDDLFVSRTYYDSSWNTFHGTSRISNINSNQNSEVFVNEYGSGAPCGGAVIKHQDSVYRSFNGGLAELNDDLSLQEPSICLLYTSDAADE